MSTRQKRRTAFTLIELLVVMMLLGILTALVVAGTFRVIDSQRQATTEETMLQIYKTFRQHWDDVVAKAKKEPPSPFAYRLASGDRQRAQVLQIKLRLMEAFPVSYQEIGNPPSTQSLLYAPLPPVVVASLYAPQPPPAIDFLIPVSSNRRFIATYQRKLAAANLANNQPATQASACLLMALAINRGGSAVNAETLGKSAISDTDLDKLDEFIDSWGNPYGVFRFPTPTNFPELADVVTSGLSPRDPVDPLATLTNLHWFNEVINPVGPWPNFAPWSNAVYNGKIYKGTLYMALFHGWAPGLVPPLKINGSIFPSNFMPAAKVEAYHTAPVLVSAGINGKLGLNPDMTINTAAPSDEYDNIYSFRLKIGARGD